MYSIATYIRNFGDVEGWLNRFDASLIARLSAFQSARGIRGSLGEIGVHHGKLFILLKLCALPGERTYAVDVFEDQALNVDGSGHGSRLKFEENVVRWTGDMTDVDIVKGDSQLIDPDRILSTNGQARLLSIDGGHTEKCTLNDLKLAERLIQPNGVIVLDDVFNREWPGVMAGFAQYLLADGVLKPFAVSSNKTYLAHALSHDIYRLFGRTNGIFIPRSAGVFGNEVMVWLEKPYVKPAPEMRAGRQSTQQKGKFHSMVRKFWPSRKE